MVILRVVLLGILSLMAIQQSNATHLRAADLVAERIGDFTYRFTLTVYTDSTTVADGAGEVRADLAPITIRSRNTILAELTEARDSLIYIGNRTYKNVFVFQYTFPAAGASYAIGYKGENRNADIVNIVGEQSDNFVLYVETSIFIDAFEPVFNRTPKLSVPPIDVAIVGQPFVHNPGAYDEDGDSLSFKLVPSLQGSNRVVTGFTFPDNIQGPSSISIDPVTGTLRWDSPRKNPDQNNDCQCDEYNIAIEIEEWRDGIKIGSVIRDMQILVYEGDNEVPDIIVPDDTCVIANQTLRDTIIATDPDGHALELTLNGEPIERSPRATFITSQPRIDSIIGAFNWTPECNLVRERSYSAIFRAEDQPTSGESLVQFETWNINVYGPEVENFNVTNTGGENLLTWSPYICDEAEFIHIYRRECDEGFIERSPCTEGVPEEWGYERIATIDASRTQYTDRDIDFINRYCYLAHTEFSFPGKGVGMASDLACAEGTELSPVIHRVSVVNTDSLLGETELTIIVPDSIDASTYPGPYELRVYRQEGMGIPANSFRGNLVQSINQTVLSDTSVIDGPLNTLNFGYTYKVSLFYNGGADSLSSSPTTSSLFLEAVTDFESIDFSWDDDVPWQYPDSLYQVLYVDTARNGNFVPEDSVRGMVDSGKLTNLINGDTACYFIQSRGIFCSENITDVSINNSQVICTSAKDTVRPCPPIAEIAAKNCEEFTASSPLQNNLSWDFNTMCENDDIVGFRLYVRDGGLEGDFELLRDFADTSFRSFLHDRLNSMAKCYYVTTVDVFGNESLPSNIVCGDNCGKYRLPNIFTPNGEGHNDFFIPIPEVLFVDSVEFRVYNRWGKQVFFSDDNIEIQWDGVGSNGEAVSDGTYFYEALVTFDKLRPEESVESIKGWVMIVR